MGTSRISYSFYLIKENDESEIVSILQLTVSMFENENIYFW